MISQILQINTSMIPVLNVVDVNCGRWGRDTEMYDKKEDYEGQSQKMVKKENEYFIFE